MHHFVFENIKTMSKIEYFVKFWIDFYFLNIGNQYYVMYQTIC